MIGLYLMAVLYIVAGVNHFVNPAFYLRMMPPYLQAPEALVFASGLAEVALGLLLCVPPLRRWAAWGIILLLIAVFPANLHMALNTGDFADLGPAWLLYARLPLQAGLILWAYRYTRPRSAS
jgi:uncharacterized membrane protein